jgi:DNA repair protein RadC
MKTVAPHDRPREKLLRFGPSVLGDNELLAVLLAHGDRRRGVLEMANELLDAAGGLHRLTRMSVSELRRVKGVGAAKASQVLAGLELGRRTLAALPPDRARFAAPRDVARFLLPQFGARSVEQFGVVLLDARHKVLKTFIVSIGTLDASVVHPREVFREAATIGAAALVLFHNHPSGDPTPSRDDELITIRMVQAGHLIGIPVLDHIVLGDTSYYSFKEQTKI